MKVISIPLMMLMLGVGCSLTACEESSGGSGGGPPPGVGAAVIYLSDANNYTYESRFHIPVVETAPTSDIDICWDDLTRDFQCHEMDPAADIGNVTLVRIRNLSEGEIEAALSRDELQQSNIDGYLNRNTNKETACVNLADFTFLDSEVPVEDEYVVSEEQKYLLVLTTGTTIGVGARMMTFMTPSHASANRTVAVGEGCDVLDFSARLTALTPVPVPSSGRTALDWSDVAPPIVTRAMLGFYEGMSVRELEEQVLDLMLIATKKWEHEIDSVAPIPLTEMVDEDGTPFEGFSGEGTWIFSVQCGQCRNPAPYLLTVLAPEGE